MIISIKTAHGYLSFQPPTEGSLDARVEYRQIDTPGDWERFDLQGLEVMIAAIAELPESIADAMTNVLKPVEPMEPDQPTQPLEPREQFFKWVEGKPFGQQTLLELEPTLRAAGWELTTPNAKGERTKLRPPNMWWVRVGFGEGQWIWLPQPEA